jgi:CubicO group peptidase (beta-lactamase class C family)
MPDYGREKMNLTRISKKISLALTLGFSLMINATADNGSGNEDARRALFEPERRAIRFQSMDRIFPSRVVKAGTNTRALEKSPLASEVEFSYEWDGEVFNVEQFIARTRSNALLILKNGKIVVEKYLNGSTAKTRFISWSVGKSFTSTLVGMAIEDGYIDDVGDPLTRYLPSLTGSAYDGVTIKDALQMVSGVEWDEYSYDWDDMSKPLNRHWNRSLLEQQYRFVEAANELPRATPPGEKYNYNTLDTSILGWLVETATKQRISRYMERRLWQPAGMEFDANWILDGPDDIGRELTGGGLNATLRDYGRFGLLMAYGGRANGRQLVSSDWVKEATTADRAAVQYGNLYEGYPLGYGYQWWLFDNGRFEAQGIYGQLIYVVPDEDVVIVSLSNWPEPWDDQLEYESYVFFDAVIDTLR